jgi:hypothetical protein
MRTGGTAIGPKGKHDPDRSATRLRAAHVTHDRQDRSLWDTHTIANGGRVLQSTLAVRRPGRYQIDAAVAALRDDAASAGETGRRQTLAWYDELFALTDDPVPQDPFAVLGRAVAVGHVLGAAAGLRQAERLAGKSEPPVRPRNHSYTDWFHENPAASTGTEAPFGLLLPVGGRAKRKPRHGGGVGDEPAVWAMEMCCRWLSVA